MEHFADILIITIIVSVIVLLILIFLGFTKLVVTTTTTYSHVDKDDTAKTDEIPISGTRSDTNSEPKDINDLCLDYKRKFLNCKPVSGRTRVSIEQAQVNLIKQLLLVIDPKVSVSGYINNVVRDHLEKCRPEIIKLYNENRSNYGS